MDKDFGICGRNKEIKEIYQYITDHVESSKSGILYLAGPPGTGKTMSVNLVLDKIQSIGKLHLNCFKATSSKAVLNKIWDALGGMGSSAKKNETEIIKRLTSKFSGRTCKPFLMVLDEMDQLPKSSNYNLFSDIFSWTKMSFSKLIIVGIANTLNLTSRCQTVVNILGNDYHSIHKIVFRPYSAKDIASILNWYLENDENFEEALVDAKAVEMISKKFARDKGDIRGALNALRSSVDDVLAENRKRQEEDDARSVQVYPTPPSTPPPNPCREKTNIASVANSVRKRERQSHYQNDNALPHHEIVIVCLHKMCSKSKDGGVDKREFYGKVTGVLDKYGVDSLSLNIDAALEQLEMQGLVIFKKRPGIQSRRIILKASESEVLRLAHNKELISQFISTMI